MLTVRLVGIALRINATSRLQARDEWDHGLDRFSWGQ